MLPGGLSSRRLTVAAVGLCVLWPQVTWAFGAREHRRLVGQVLAQRVKPRFVRLIIAGNLELDARLLTMKQDANHFNDCAFRESGEQIRQNYERARRRLSRGEAAAAARYFGRALHTAQDFYAHSNWIESQPLEEPDAELSLVAPTWRGPWRALSSASQGKAQNFVLLQGTPPSGSRPRWEEEHRGFRVSTADGRRGIISGAVGNWMGTSGRSIASFRGSVQCPRPVIRGHWEAGGHGLHKDRGGRPNFALAFSYAREQTEVEICRLVELARGDPSAREHLARWSSDGKIESLCRLSDDFPPSRRLRAIAYGTTVKSTYRVRSSAYDRALQLDARVRTDVGGVGDRGFGTFGELGLRAGDFGGAAGAALSLLRLSIGAGYPGWIGTVALSSDGDRGGLYLEGAWTGLFRRKKRREEWSALIGYEWKTASVWYGTFPSIRLGVGYRDGPAVSVAFGLAQ